MTSVTECLRILPEHRRQIISLSGSREDKKALHLFCEFLRVEYEGIQYAEEEIDFADPFSYYADCIKQLADIFESKTPNGADLAELIDYKLDDRYPLHADRL